LPALRARVGLSKAQIDRLEARGKFPRRIPCPLHGAGTVRDLQLAEAHPALFAVAAGSLEAFLADRRVAAYFSADRYVIAEFVGLVDAIMLERRLRDCLEIGALLRAGAG